jgi:hypothetical protein
LISAFGPSPPFPNGAKEGVFGRKAAIDTPPCGDPPLSADALKRQVRLPDLSADAVEAVAATGYYPRRSRFFAMALAA